MLHLRCYARRAWWIGSWPTSTPVAWWANGTINWWFTLAAVSRKLARPLAIVVQSSSAAGESSLMDAVLAMMPQEEREIAPLNSPDTPYTLFVRIGIAGGPDHVLGFKQYFEEFLSCWTIFAIPVI
jgi:hypothetical protein